MHVLALIPAEQIQRLRAALRASDKLDCVASSAAFHRSCRSGRVDLAVINPSAARDVSPSAVATAFPLDGPAMDIPVIAYLRPQDVRPSLALLRTRAADLVLFDSDDAPDQLGRRLERAAAQGVESRGAAPSRTGSIVS
jgi:hypothetical protein